MKMMVGAVSLDGDPITCGEGSALQPVDYDDLAPGVQYAIDTDLTSTTGSTLQPDLSEQVGADLLTEDSGADRSTTDEPTHARQALPSPENFTFLEFTQPRVGMLSSDYYQTSRFESENNIWSETCVIPKEYVWRSSSNSFYEQRSRNTLLIPQVNFVSADGKELELQLGMKTRAYLDRTIGSEMIFNQIDAQNVGSGWWFDLDENRHADRLLHNGLDVVVLQKTEYAARREIALIFYAIAAGLIGTFSTQAWRLWRDAHSSPMHPKG